MTQLAVIETKSEIVKHNLNEMSKVRAEIVRHPAVINALSDNQMRVAEAGTKSPIRALPPQAVKEKFKAFSMFIPREIGITKWNDSESMQYERTRFYDMVTKYYSEMSLEEVKLAFELVNVGELDEYLPKSQGRADRSHYQTFSVEYITKVLNAYREFKKGTWKKAHLALPEHEKEVTEEEKVHYKKSFHSRIIEMFEQYRDEGTIRNFPAPGMITDELRKANLLKEESHPSKENVSRAIHMVMADSMTTAFDKHTARDKGIDSEIVRARAYYFSRNEEIKRVFDELIKSDLDLKDFLV